MVGLEDGEFPNVYALNDEDQLQEARRLFYVGVTRAKNQVHFLYDSVESRFVAGITGHSVEEAKRALPDL